ncbi:SDR family oxidoreductase [uncultured Alsobacter sp.]|uniref:SDR family oxidoreductase n=1 Tax=uncultured Alsobacter sp. TaxID=1748258 RepID=UPI0025E7F692|nr:SDR family oxidoreductase [uncultured Alsobacter sp.]
MAGQTQRPETVFHPELLAGKVVVISGGGSGLGRALVLAMAKLGAKIAICGRRQEPLDETARLVAEQGGAPVFAKAMSIRDPEAVNAFFDDVYAHFGTVDILVNNAGGQFAQAAIDFSVKGWNAVVDTNLNGTWWMMQAAARRWRDRDLPGSIVNVVAVVWRGLPGIAHSCAARAGVVYLSKTVAIEWAPLNIRVNCVAAGAIATAGLETYSDEARRELPRSNLMQRFGETRDVTDAVIYLASASGSFVTGEALVVDGGNQIWGDQWTIPRPAYFGGPAV